MVEGLYNDSSLTLKFDSVKVAVTFTFPALLPETVLNASPLWSVIFITVPLSPIVPENIPSTPSKYLSVILTFSLGAPNVYVVCLPSIVTVIVTIKRTSISFGSST